MGVALRKESVDRNNAGALPYDEEKDVALRKESVDRNNTTRVGVSGTLNVALRKESVDRNNAGALPYDEEKDVALRKESVDRNKNVQKCILFMVRRSPQGERG